MLGSGGERADADLQRLRRVRGRSLSGSERPALFLLNQCAGGFGRRDTGKPGAVDVAHELP